MAASSRIKAQDILFKIGSTEYACDATMVDLVLEDAPGDVQTFCEQRVGGQWALTLEGITSGEATSLYRVLWANFGSTGTFTIAPQGNTTATSSAPHYTGTVKFNQLPPLSLVTNETVKFSVTLEVDNAEHDPENDVYYGVEVKTA